MINKINLTFRKIALILLFVGISALLILFSGNQKLFKADALDPIESGTQCSSFINNLTVDDFDGQLNWTVNPSFAGVFLDIVTNEEITQTHLEGDHSVNFFLTNYALIGSTINIAATSDVPSSDGSFATFEFPINLAPPCVTSLTFADPSGIVNPGTDGTFEIKTINIIKADGSTKDYNGSEIDQLIIAGLRFTEKGEDELPGGIIQTSSDYKFKVTTDDPGEIVMKLDGNAVESELTSTNSLEIGQGLCEDFKISIVEGAGQAMNINSTAKGSKSIVFDFEEFDASNIVLQNTGEGSQFEIEFIFDENLEDKAKSSYDSVGNQYTIKVRYDGQNKQTADNFRYAVNTYLSDYFIAYNEIGTNAGVYLQSLERGVHTNNYACAINDYKVFENLCAPHLNIADDSVCNGIFLGDEHNWDLYKEDGSLNLPLDGASSYIQYNNDVNGVTRISAREFGEASDTGYPTPLANNKLYAEWTSSDGTLIFRCPNYNANSDAVTNFDHCKYYLDINADGDFEDITIPSDPSDDIVEGTINNSITPAYASQVQLIFNLNDSFFTQKLVVNGEICGNGLNDDADEYPNDNDDPDCFDHISTMFDGSSSSIDNCFTVGEGDTPSNPVKFINSPINQMDTHLIYALGGTLPIEWETLNSDIIGLSLPGEELTEEDLLGNDDVLFPRQMIDSDEIDKSLNINKNACDVGTDGMYASCEVSVLANLTYTTDDLFNVTIILKDSNKEGSVNLIGDGILGLITSEPVDIYVDSPKIITLNGFIDGSVNGDAIGGVKADVLLTVEATLGDHGEVITTINSLEFYLIKDETLIPSDRNPDPDAVINSVYSVLTARRSGTAKITATDKNNCTATLPIDVQPINLYIDFANSEDAEKDSFKAGDTISLKAWIGYNKESEGENVISKINWTIGDPEVASIDETGLLTFLQEGRVSLFGTYAPETAEIPPLVSDNFVIETNSLTGLTLSLDRSALDKLPTSVRNNAYESLYLAIHSSDLTDLTIEGETVNFNSLDLSELNSEKERVDVMTNHLVEDGKNIDGVSITKVNDMVGVVILTAKNYPSTNSSDLNNGRIDISEVSRDFASIFSPNVKEINLPITEDYNLIIIGEYLNGTTKRLNATDVDLISSLGFLNQGSLDSRVLKFKSGEQEGSASVRAYSKDKSVKSGEFLVKVSSGPIVLSLNMNNTGSVKKDSSTSFNVEVSDIDGVDDVESINIELYNANNNGGTIGSRLNAATPYVSYTKPISTLVTYDDDGNILEIDTTTEIITNKTFKVDYTIPNTPNILDGDYILNFIVKDFAGHKTLMKYPIYIGAVASGNVSMDSKIDKIDVLYIYQIAVGKREPTPAQKLAADIDGNGKITILDALLLFKQINNK